MTAKVILIFNAFSVSTTNSYILHHVVWLMVTNTATFSATNLTQTGLGSNQGHWGDRVATSYLSQGTSCQTYQSAGYHLDPHCCFHCALDCLQRNLEAACVLAMSWPSLCQVCHLFYLLSGVCRCTWIGEDTFCKEYVYCCTKGI